MTTTRPLPSLPYPNYAEVELASDMSYSVRVFKWVSKYQGYELVWEESGYWTRWGARHRAYKLLKILKKKPIKPKKAVKFTVYAK